MPVCNIDFDEPCGFWHEERPKARKEHLCNCCGAVIHKGETYRRVTMGFDGSASTEKACALCDADMEAFEAAHRVNLSPTAFYEELVNCVGWDDEGKRWLPMAEAVKLRRKTAKEAA